MRQPSNIPAALALAEPTSTAAAPEEATSAEEPVEHLRAILRHRAIALRTLSAPLRLIVWLAIVQLLLIGVAILLRDRGLPAMRVYTADDGTTVTMPIVSFALSLLSLALALSFVLTGALRSPWYVRFPVLAIVSLLALFQMGSVIPSVDAQDITSDGQTLAGNIAAADLGALLLLWIWAIVGTIVDWRAARRGKDRSAQGHRFPWATFLFVLAILLVHGALVEIAVANFSGSSTVVDFAEVLTLVTQYLFLLLVPVFFLTGTDYAEVGEVLAAHAGRVLRRTGKPWRLAGATALVAALVIVYGALDLKIQQHTSFWVVVVTLLVVGPLLALIGAGVLSLVLRLGLIQGWAVRRVPFGALVTTAVLPVLAPILGLILVIRGRRRAGGALAISGLFFLAFSTVGLVSLVKLAGLPGIELVVAPATLVVLLWLIVRRRINQQAVGLLVALLTLTLGLQIVAWVFDLFALAKTLSSDSLVALALLVILAQLWDLLMSGEQVTNINGRRFPRNVRILLYVGYVMLASTLLLYFTSSSSPTVVGPIDNDDISLAGLALLGVPLLVTGFILSYGHWRGHGQSGYSGSVPAPVQALAQESALAGAQPALDSSPTLPPGMPPGMSLGGGDPGVPYLPSTGSFQPGYPPGYPPR